jgi:hypothetical protein
MNYAWSEESRHSPFPGKSLGIHRVEARSLLPLREQLDSVAESSLLCHSFPFPFRRDHKVIIVDGIREEFDVAAVILIG